MQIRFKAILIGALVMTHGDDSGLIFPPRVAPYQVVIVPIPRGNWRETVLPHAQAIAGELTADAGFLVRKKSLTIGYLHQDVSVGPVSGNTDVLVELEPDVAAMFPSAEAVNEALRFLIRITKSNEPTVPAAKGEV